MVSAVQILYYTVQMVINIMLLFQFEAVSLLKGSYYNYFALDTPCIIYLFETEFKWLGEKKYRFHNCTQS